jgi:hypothetical protein
MEGEVRLWVSRPYHRVEQALREQNWERTPGPKAVVAAFPGVRELA